MIDISPFVAGLNGRPVAVFGLARSGLATVKACHAAGARVIAWDDNQSARDKAQALGAETAPLTPEILEQCACLVLAPGVPLTHNPHQVVLDARALGMDILGDIEILHRCNPGRRVIGITGTNGKSTTTAIIDHVLRACGVAVTCGGNIGKAVLELDMPPEEGVFVLELSSYQLDLCPTFSPDIAVLLNITPDHLDRHGSMEEYAAAKARIFRGAQVAIIGADIRGYAGMPVPSISVIPRQNQFYVEKDMGQVWTEGRSIFGDGKACADLTGVTTLPGEHNMQNAAAAYAAVMALGGMNPATVAAALRTYPGLPHRQFPVRKIGDVLYINDSKATNAEAAGKALASYDDIFWILGGQAKEGGLSGLESFMPRIREAFLIGEAADEFSVFLKAHNVPFQKSGDLKSAVNAAHEKAQAFGGGVVLLSPACASFDQFTSFEDRGDRFAEFVQSLKEKN